MAGLKRTFVFDTETDADLLAALDNLGNGEKSGVVRDALRQYFRLQESQPAEPTMTEVIKRLDYLQGDMAWLRQHGVSLGEPKDDDDPALTAALLNLGL